jgi:hypothetical protein
VATKTAGEKSYPSQKEYDFALKLRGMKKAQIVDMISQEAKVPARILMSSFGIMEKETQKKFLNMFLPKSNGQDKGVAALVQYVEDSYNNPTPTILADEMAIRWSKATGKDVSADMLFSEMFVNIMNTTGEKEAEQMWRDFGIGLPGAQWVKGNVYNKTGKDEMIRLLKQGQDEGKIVDYSQFIRFDPYTGGNAKYRKDEFYRMYYRIPDSGTAVVQAGKSFVPEYQFKTGFLNSKAILSLVQNYPLISQHLGLTNDLESWAGVFNNIAYAKGKPESVTKSANVLFPYTMFEADLRSGIAAVPNNAISLNSELATAILGELEAAGKMPTDQAMLEDFIKRIFCVISVNHYHGCLRQFVQGFAFHRLWTSNLF